MKHTHKNNAGFTLVELVVAMAMAVIVTAAATSVLLLGLRVNRQTADTASQQMTVRSLLSVVEKAAADGNIQEIVSGYDSWELIGKESRSVFLYSSKDQAISVNGVKVLGNVYASNATFSNGLLTISVETKEGIYSSSVYCRMAVETSGDSVEDIPETVPTVPDDDKVTTDANRLDFLDILKGEYRSRGEIRKGDGQYTYYSEWYIQGYPGNPGWNAKTPWCACYVSWALVQTGKSGPMGSADTTADDHPRWFANVDEFIAYFQTNKYGSYGQSWLDREAGTPKEGDLIFFDWDKGTDPEHVGVVLSVNESERIVYTIEGNSAGRVTIRSYSLGDPRIIGYGVLSWS